MEFQSDTEQLRLKGKISINDAESLVNVLMQYIQTQQEIVKINLAEVETMDIMALQVLIAAQRTTKQANKRFELLNIKDKLCKTFELSGMDFIFEQEEELSPLSK